MMSRRCRCRSRSRRVFLQKICWPVGNEKVNGYYRWDGKYVPPIANAPKIKPPIISKKNHQYFDTYDELERIYAEVVKEAGGVPDYNRGPSPIPKQYEKYDFKPYEWKPYKQEYPSLTYLKSIVAEPEPEPEPTGVTLEELFAQDEAEDGETL